MNYSKGGEGMEFVISGVESDCNTQCTLRQGRYEGTCIMRGLIFSFLYLANLTSPGVSIVMNWITGFQRELVFLDLPHPKMLRLCYTKFTIHTIGHAQVIACYIM